MNELAELTIKTHGGLKRWGQFESVSAHLDQGGALWALKGQAGTLDHTCFRRSTYSGAECITSNFRIIW